VPPDERPVVARKQVRPRAAGGGGARGENIRHSHRTEPRTLDAEMQANATFVSTAASRAAHKTALARDDVPVPRCAGQPTGDELDGPGRA
jgi:hypothetical protein